MAFPAPKPRPQINRANPRRGSAACKLLSASAWDERGMLARPDRYPSGMGNAVTTGFPGFFMSGYRIGPVRLCGFMPGGGPQSSHFAVVSNMYG
jgi:hypothetical protein